MEKSIIASEQLPTDDNKETNTVQKQRAHKHGDHSEHAHDELDSDCEGCQGQKVQNQKLVNFYQRLDKISNTMKRIKNPNNNCKKGNQSQGNKQVVNEYLFKQLVTPQKLQFKLKQLNQKLNIEELPSVNQIKDFSSKEIGFELAAALIERQMKYKNQNKKLQQKINQLLAEKKKKQEDQALIQSYHYQSNKMNFSNQNYPEHHQNQEGSRNRLHQRQTIQDSLNDFNSKEISNKRKQKDDSSYWDIDANSTSSFKYQQTTFFQTKKRKNNNLSDQTKFQLRHQNQEQLQQSKANIKKKNPYSTEQGYGLNLWLYQFKPQQYQQKLANSWISDKNKKGQVPDRYNNLKKEINQPANIKSPRLSNVNKTAIIENNILNGYSSINQTKKRPY